MRRKTLSLFLLPSLSYVDVVLHVTFGNEESRHVFDKSMGKRDIVTGTSTKTFDEGAIYLGAFLTIKRFHRPIHRY